MKRTIIPWLSFLCFPLIAFSQDLNCGLESSWELQPNSSQTFTIDVSGYSNDQLSDRDQGLCGVEIGFAHNAIKDLEIWLVSPDDQEVQLIGPNVDGPFIGFGANWQITFVPSMEMAEPMPGGYAARWTNNQSPNLTVTGFGSYYPYIGNLEDFDSGDVNGIWRVEVRTDPTSAITFPVGIIYHFRLIFCDESGTSCCLADAGNLIGDDISACQGDPSLDIAPPKPSYTFSIRPDSFLYEYTYLVTQDNQLLERTDDPDFTGYAPGEYGLYGLSYQVSDTTLVRELDLDAWSLSDLRDSLTNDLPIFCGDITADSLLVQVIRPEASIAPPDTLRCSLRAITLEGGGSTPAGRLSYEWLDASGNTLGNGTQQTVDTPGVYRLVAGLLESECRDTATVAVIADFTEPVADAGATLQLNCAQSEQQIGGAGTSTGPAFVYQWSTTGGNILSPPDTIRPVVNAAGTYYLEVTDTLNGCSARDSVVITEDFTLPPADAGEPDTLTCIATEQVLGGPATATGSNIAYSWTSPDSDFITSTDLPEPTVDAPGTYILAVTDTDNGCTATDTVQIFENVELPSADAGLSPTLTCTETPATLGGAGTDRGNDFSHQWSTTDGHFTTSPDIPQPSVDQAGTYVLKVTDLRNGCTARDTVVVLEDTDSPVADAGRDSVLTCDVVEIQIGGASTAEGPGFEYDWTTPDGQIVSSAGDRRPIIDAPGVYTLVVTDLNNGCQAQDEVVIGENRSSPAVNAGPASTLTCRNPLLRLDGSRSDQGVDFSYEWRTVDGNILDGGNTLTPLIDRAGNYELRITNTTTGCTNSGTVAVGADFRLPQVIIAEPPLLDCERSTVQLDAAASDSGSRYSFFWRDLDAGGGLTGGNSLTPATDVPGRYELVLVDENNGCRDSAIVVVRDTTVQVIADPGIPPVITCSQPVVSLDAGASSAGPDILYQWSTNVGQIEGPSDRATIEVSAPGVYQLLVRDTFTRCESAAQIIVGLNTEAPAVDAGPEKTLTCSATETLLEGSGMTAESTSLRFEWSGPCIVGGRNSPAARVNCAGTYLLAVENTDNGCIGIDSVLVTQDAAIPVAAIAEPDTLTCEIGSVVLDATASAAGNTEIYQWSGPGIVSGEQGLEPVVNAPGTYTLSVTNLTNSCVGTASVEVLENKEPPVVDAGSDLVLDCRNAIVVAGNPAAAEGLIYSWSTINGVLSGPADRPILSIDIPGDYILRATDPQSGCSAEDRVTVELDNETPSADAGPTQTLDCSRNTVTLNGSNSMPAPGPGILYEWAGSCLLTDPSGPVVEVDCPGVYQLQITDTRNGCTAVDSVLVRRDDNAPQAIIADTAYIDCETGEALLNGSSSTGGFFTWWRDDVLIEQGDQAIRVFNPGTYLLIIENPSLGCSDTAMVAVVEDCKPQAIILAPDTLSCRRDIVTIDATPSSAGDIYRYRWTTSADGCIIDGAASPRLRVRCAGLFTLVVTNTAVQRSDTAQVRVEVDTSAPVAVVSLPDTITCVAPTVSLDASGSSTGAVFDYYWSDFNGDTISNELVTTVARSGAYLFEVVNRRNGCRSVDFAVVSKDNALPEITFGRDIIPCRQDTFRLEARVTPAADYEYQWTGPGILADGNTSAVLVDRPGNYQLSVFNPDNGCDGLATVTLEEEGCGPCVEVLPPDTIDCLTDTIRLEAALCDICNSCSIQWSTTDGVLLEGAATLRPLVGGAGNYTLRITNAQGFITERRVTVAEDRRLPTAEAGPDRSLSCDSTVLTLRPVAGTILDNYRYEWQDQNGAPLADREPLSVDRTGVFTLEVIDENNGCRATDVVEVTTDTVPPVAAAGDRRRLNCDTPFVTLDATGSSLGGSIRYAWSGPVPGSILTGAATPNPAVNAAGFYRLTVTELRNGCSATDSVLVEQEEDLPLLPDVDAVTLSCDRPTRVLNGTVSGAGSYRYEWCRLDGAGNPLGCSARPERLVDAPGRYRLEILDTLTGCTNSLTVDVDEDVAPPQVEAGGGGTLGCGDNGFPLRGSAGPAGAELRIQWTASGGEFIEGANSLNATAFAPGTYVLTVTNRGNGCSASDSVVIDQDEAAPQVMLGAPAKITCSQRQVLLAAQADTESGQVQWSWQTNEGVILSGGDSGMPLVGAPGRYEVEVTDPANGCTSIMALMVEENTVPPQAAVDSSGGLFFSCNTEQVVLDASLSSTVSDALLLYSWQVISGAPIIGNPTDARIAVDQTGVYQLVVTSADNGCRDTLDVLVREDPAVPVIRMEQPETITCDRRSVVLDGGASSSGPDFRYRWRNEQGTLLSEEAILTVDEGGSYEFQVLNEMTGCADSTVVAVQVDTLQPVAQVAPVDRLDCLMEQASLDGSSSSAGPDIRYRWSTTAGNILDGAERAVAVIDAPGAYILTVRNLRNGCEAQTSVQVEQAGLPIEEVFVDILPPSCSGDGTGTIRIDSVRGGTAPYVYALGEDLFNMQPFFSGLAPGTYSLRVQDSNGCEWAQTVVVPEVAELTVDLGADIVLDLGDSVRLEAVVSGGAYDRLIWSPADGIAAQGKPVQVVRPFETTTYSVMVESQGCRASDFVTITISKSRNIFIPTAFSPNGDGTNDVFFLQTGPDVREVKSFMIFDRWGNNVYEGGPFPPNDSTYGWDGKLDGQPMNAGVFVFFAEVEFVDGWVERVKGDVVLVR